MVVSLAVAGNFTSRAFVVDIGAVVLGDVAVSSVLDPYPYFICIQGPCGSICGSGSGATK